MRKIYALLLGLALWGAAVPALTACPLCRDAIPAANTDEDEENHLPVAMNRSILSMLAVGYTSLVVVGAMIYRGMKQNEAYRASLEAAATGDALA